MSHGLHDEEVTYLRENTDVESQRARIERVSVVLATYEALAASARERLHELADMFDWIIDEDEARPSENHQAANENIKVLL